jgi:hypothetical protein
VPGPGTDDTYHRLGTTAGRGCTAIGAKDPAYGRQSSGWPPSAAASSAQGATGMVADDVLSGIMLNLLARAGIA